MSINISTNILTHTNYQNRIKLGEETMKKIPDLVPISALNKGKAGQIIKDVKDNNNVKLIVKNNEVEAVIISLDQYNEMLRNEFLASANPLPRNRNAKAVGGQLHKYVTEENRNADAGELYRIGLDEKYGK